MVYPSDKRIGERILTGFVKDDCPYIIRTFYVQVDGFRPLQRFEIKTRNNISIAIDRYDEVEGTLTKVTDDIQTDELIVYLADLIGE